MYRFMIIALVLGITCSVNSFADEVIFKNGERVTGKVIDLLDGTIKITSDTMGDVSAPLDSISTFSTEAPLEIHFMDGSVFTKDILAHEDGWIKIAVGPDLQPMEFKIADIEKINPPEVQWKGNITIGASISRGNSHTQDFYGSLKAVRRSEVDRISIEGNYLGKREKDDTTGRKYTSERKTAFQLKYDYFFTDDIYGYAMGRMVRDASAELDIRFTAGTGAGYQIYETETFDLAVEGGLTWTSEQYKDLTDDASYLGARAAYGLEKDFNSYVTFFNRVEWNQAFEGEGGHLAYAEAGLRSSFIDSMFAEFKTILTWDSTPADSAKRTDVTYLFSLGWTF